MTHASQLHITDEAVLITPYEHITDIVNDCSVPSETSTVKFRLVGTLIMSGRLREGDLGEVFKAFKNMNRLFQLFMAAVL